MERLQEPVSVHEMDLDPKNPRLPEEIQGQSQAVILQHLWENDNLEEIIDSYLANGYFQSEPIIALPPAGGRRVVVEGNRRLASLMILHQLAPAVAADIDLGPDYEFSEQDLTGRGLSALPVVQANDAEDVAAFLGFRHISGLKRWGPEAKARWLFLQVEEKAVSESPRGVFYDVGRQVGSNARGVRSAYVAFGSLRYARDILQVDNSLIRYVSEEKFGVWTRLLGTANVSSYIGLSDKPTLMYNSVVEQFHRLDRDRMSEVLGDLRPPATKNRAVLGDSRDVTDYSDVLLNENARLAMREHNSLSLATQIAKQGELAGRLRSMVVVVETMTLDVRRVIVTVEDDEAATELAAASRTLRSAIAGALDEAKSL